MREERFAAKRHGRMRRATTQVLHCYPAVTEQPGMRLRQPHQALLASDTRHARARAKSAQLECFPIETLRPLVHLSKGRQNASLVPAPTTRQRRANRCRMRNSGRAHHLVLSLSSTMRAPGTAESRNESKLKRERRNASSEALLLQRPCATRLRRAR